MAHHPVDLATDVALIFWFSIHEVARGAVAEQPSESRAASLPPGSTHVLPLQTIGVLGFLTLRLALWLYGLWSLSLSKFL